MRVMHYARKVFRPPLFLLSLFLVAFVVAFPPSTPLYSTKHSCGSTCRIELCFVLGPGSLVGRSVGVRGTSACMAPSFFTPQCIRPGIKATSFVPQKEGSAVQVVRMVLVLCRW